MTTKAMILVDNICNSCLDDVFLMFLMKINKFNIVVGSKEVICGDNVGCQRVLLPNPSFVCPNCTFDEL